MGQWYYVVFNNDAPLVVCTSEAEAKVEVERQKNIERKRQFGHRGAPGNREADEYMKRCYFHYHTVPSPE